MTGLPILQISELRKSYGAVRAVDDVNVHVERGEICGLIGPNGSGKSTFFDCASGLTRPDAGTVKLDGQDITGWSLSRIAREGRMLRSFQKTVTFSALDVEENLIIAGQMFTFPSLWSTLVSAPFRGSAFTPSANARGNSSASPGSGTCGSSPPGTSPAASKSLSSSRRC